jgi:hypothetical protein
MVQNAYHLTKENNIEFSCHTFLDIINIYQLSTIQTLLWLPLKLILLVKPEGAVLRKNDLSSISQQFSRGCYCCCGLAINYLHKMSVNPFLVLTLQPTLDDLSTALSAVQEVYHQSDPAYDKTSLWVYANLHSCIDCQPTSIYRFFQLPMSLWLLFRPIASPPLTSRDGSSV